MTNTTQKIIIKKKFFLEELPVLAQSLRAVFKPKQIVLLSGPLGAGKTTLTRFLLKNKEVMSPGFSICHTYYTKQETASHVDLYRLKDDDDLESTGFWDLFQTAPPAYLKNKKAGAGEREKPRTLILIEWAERLKIRPPGWPAIGITLQFTSKPNERLITALHL